MDDSLEQWRAEASRPRAREIVPLRCDGEFVGEMHNARYLHRPCRHRRCTIGGARVANHRRWHVYDVLTGEIADTYDRLEKG